MKLLKDSYIEAFGEAAIITMFGVYISAFEIIDRSNFYNLLLLTVMTVFNLFGFSLTIKLYIKEKKRIYLLLSTLFIIYSFVVFPIMFFSSFI